MTRSIPSVETEHRHLRPGAPAPAGRRPADRYEAFISYKHGASLPFASRLAQAIKGHAKPLLARPMRVFRDEDHFVPDNDLPALVRNALEASEYLILLASAEAAESRWVKSELRHWCEGLGRTERLVIILVDGEIALDSKRDTIDWSRTTALPTLLKEHFPAIPLYADLSWVQREEELDVSHPKFKHLVNAVVARIRGIDPNTMLGEEVRQHRRNVRFLIGAGVTLAASLIAALIMYGRAEGAVDDANRARREEAAARQVADTKKVEAIEARDGEKLAKEDALLAATRERRAKEEAIAANEEAQRQREDAVRAGHTANSRALALEALQARRQPEMLHLAIAASEEAPTREAELSLRGALAAPRLQLIRQAHAGGIVHVEFSPGEGREILTSGKDRTARLWDATSGRQLAVFSDGGGVSRYSPDGNSIVIGTQRDVAWLWKRVGERFRRIAALGDPNVHGRMLTQTSTVTFSPDGERVVVGRIASMRLHDAIDGRFLASLSGSLRTVSYSRDGRFILGADLGEYGGGVARLWDGATGAARDIDDVKHARSVYAAALDAQGTLLATGSEDGVVRLFERRADEGGWTGKREFAGHTGAVTDVEFVPGTNLILASTIGGGTSVWNIETGARSLGRGEPFGTAKLHPGGERAFYAEAGAVFDWRWGSMEEAVRYAAHRGDVGSFALSPDGERLATAGADGVLAVWSTSRAGELPVFSSGAYIEDARRVAGRLSAIGKDRIWEVRRDGSAEVLWPKPDMRPTLKSFIRVSSRLQASLWTSLDGAVWFTPRLEHGTSVRLASDRDWSKFTCWVNDDGSVGSILKGNTRAVLEYPGSASAPQIVQCNGRCEKLSGWSNERLARFFIHGRNGSALATRRAGAPTWTLDVSFPATIGGVAFSPDGSLLALQSRADDALQLFSTQTGERLWREPDVGVIRALGFDARGLQIVAVGGDKPGGGEVNVWSALTGRDRKRLGQHDYPVEEGVFSPSGDLLLTASRDAARVVVWRIQSGEPLHQFEHEMPRAIQFDPGGTEVLVASRREIWRHALRRDDLLAAARARRLVIRDLR